MSSALKKVRPDAKGRIFLGILTKGVSSYTVTKDNGRIILEPNVEIPAKEKWLWENKKALQQVSDGLNDSAALRTKSRGSHEAINRKQFAVELRELRETMRQSASVIEELRGEKGSRY